MTPDNDKTLRSIFCKAVVGWDEWDDRRDYRRKYESSEFHLGNGVGNSILRIMSYYIEDTYGKKNILKDNVTDSEEYMHFLSKIMPESKQGQEYDYMMSFGMARNIDGTFSNCDCCGKDLNIINSSKFAMCDACYDVHSEKIIPKIDLR
jgi:hypothetical protein